MLENREFAPEYAQQAYEHAVKKEVAIGDYFSECPLFESSPAHRKEMILLIELLNTKKSYKLETFFLAVNIADRYLQALARQGAEAPSHVLLAVTAIMIAGKHNESMRPCFDYTALALPELLRDKVSLQQFINLEIRILNLLQFDLTFDSPLFFLDRFLHLFGLDMKNSAVANTAHSLCQFMKRESHFLRYKPSQMASASLIYAIHMINEKSNGNALPLIAEKIRENGLSTECVGDSYASLWT